MKLIIVRHGETDHNRTNVHMGQLDVALNQRGEEQAELVGQQLAKEKIDIIYSSDLIRAKTTAEKIAKHHLGLTVQYDPELRERNVGELEGQPFKEQQFSFLENRNDRPRGGESMDDLKSRAQRWFNQLKKRHQAETIAVVGHGGFLYVFLEVAVEDGADVAREDFLLKHCGITVLEIHPEGRAQIVHLNEIDR
jgi:probable phosphoglycerate mutase